jgi:membrane-bound metal-dependent hydrolase YbcI (DUF457 family)
MPGTMYLGHLAAGLVLKSRVREAPLSWLLFATVLPDLLCGVFLIAGLEHTVVEGTLVFGHLDSDIGYSHSLLATLLCAALASVAAGASRRSRRVGAAVALAVLSHYTLDALTHRPDMPLIGFGSAHDVRLGTDLARHPVAFYLVELLWCTLAWCVFDGRSRRLALTMSTLMVLYTNSVFGFAPPPIASMPVFGVVMIALFTGTAAIMTWAARPLQSR